MLWPWTHLVIGVVLLIAIIGGLVSSLPHAKIWMMVARLCYIILLISGFLMLGYAWHEHPLLLIVKLVLALGFIGVTEIAFAHKIQQKLSRSLIYIVLVLFVIVVIVGFWLTGGFPLFK